MSMEDRIQLLPLWRLSNPYPAFYDTESGSSIEQTSKVYEAMRQLQMDYNKFATEINQIITDFVNGMEADQQCFEDRMTKTIHDYIALIDLKIDKQNKEISEAIVYMKENILTSLAELTAQMKESGELSEAIMDSFNSLELRVQALENASYHTYDSTSETLSIHIVENQDNVLYVNNMTNYSIDKENESVDIEESES